MGTPIPHQVESIIQRALAIGRAAEFDHDALSQLENEALQIQGFNNYMKLWLDENFPPIPIYYLVRYTGRILLKYSNHDPQAYLNCSPYHVSGFLNSTCLSGSLFDMDILSVYARGWEDSSMEDSNPMIEIRDLIEEDWDEYALGAFDPSQYPDIQF